MPEEHHDSQNPNQFQPQSPDLQPSNDVPSQGDAVNHTTPIDDREPIVSRDEVDNLSYGPPEGGDYDKNAHAIDAGAATELPLAYRQSQDKVEGLRFHKATAERQGAGSVIVDRNREIQKEQHVQEIIRNWAVALQEARAKNVELPKDCRSTHECLREEQRIKSTGNSIKNIKRVIGRLESALDSRDSSSVIALVATAERFMDNWTEEYMYSQYRSIDSLASNLANEFDLGISTDELQKLRTDCFITRAEYLETACQVINRGLDVKQALNDQRKAEFEEFKRSIGFVEPEKEPDAAEHAGKSQA